MSAHPPTAGPDLLKALQERAAKAQPADLIEYSEGWWLRYTAGSSWWLASALPHSEPKPVDLLKQVMRAEDFYTARSAKPLFQITPGVCPAELDGLLGMRGYSEPYSHTSLQTAETIEVLNRVAPSQVETRMDDHLTFEWFQAWQETHSDGSPERDRALFERVDLPSTFARISLDGKVIAIGRGVADNGWTGVFDVATLPEARGKGAARAILRALAEWAKTREAAGMYLQVQSQNTAAMSLYERTAFTEVLTYHYRVAA